MLAPFTILQHHPHMFACLCTGPCSRSSRKQPTSLPQAPQLGHASLPADSV
jgi:hypothetical protein